MIKAKNLLVTSLAGFILTALLLCSSIPAAAQFNFSNGRSRETFTFKFVKNLVVIQVRINDTGPFNFVLDTGVSTFLITDPTLFKLLNLTSYREVKIAGLGEGNDLSAYVANSVNVKIGSTIEGLIPVAILKEDKLDLSGFTGMPVHGLLGYEFFNSFIVRFRYSTNTLTAFKNDSYIPKKGLRLPITIEERKPYLSAEVQVSDTVSFRAKLIIDTGAGHPVSLESMDGKQIVIPSNNIRASLGVGLSGPISGHISRLKSIGLGKFEMNNVVASFPDYEDVGAKVLVNRNGNIGNALLKHFDVVFDYTRERLYLRPSIFFREPFEHDMSGIQMESKGDNFERIFIRSVDPESAADLAGLAEGDQIMAVNFKPVKELSINEIENMFRSANGRNYLLDIVSATTKKREIVVLTLKRRV